MEEGSDLDNTILSQGPHLVLDQLNELRLTTLRRPLHSQFGGAPYIATPRRYARAVICEVTARAPYRHRAVMSRPLGPGLD